MGGKFDNRTCRRVGRSVALALAVLGLCHGSLRVCAQSVSEPKPASERKPNIILVVADDLGYGDLGSYGQVSMRTPHLDRLAAEGKRFTDHYAGSATGAASRCALLTGRHTGHARIRGNADALLSADDLTVAELLRKAGYTTAAIGKWGVGHPPPPDDPAKHGFDSFYGYLDRWHAHNHFPDFLWKNGVRCAINGNVVRVIGKGGIAIKRQQYSQHLFTTEALTFVEQHAKKPFFLFLAPTLPHANNEAGDEGMEVPNAEPYSGMGWPQAQRNRASMVTRLDHSVGRLVELLNRLDLARHTLILFTSDNGPSTEGGADLRFFNSTGGLRGLKGDLYEGGIRVPLIAWWPGKIPPGAVTSHACTLWDFLATAAEIAGSEPPSGTDGISYLPALLGQDEQQKQHEFLYWEHHGRGSVQAVRFGHWKAVRPFGQPTELYDLSQDRGEQHDSAARFPDTVRIIEGYLKAARTESSRFPLKEAAK